jgi:hypothetical protein
VSEGPAFLDIPQVEILHRVALERHGGQDACEMRPRSKVP